MLTSRAVRRRGAVYAMRNLLRDSNAVRQFCQAPELQALVESVLGPGAIAVRTIFFNKPFRANWQVNWHQDLTVALRARASLPEFGGWTRKSGIVHARASQTVLQQMLTLRIHLDAIDAENGALLVMPGSHQEGILKAEQVQSLCQQQAGVLCAAPAGSVMAMQPLLLHSSRSSHTSTRERRVLHIEYAAAGILPEPLRWAFAD